MLKDITQPMGSGVLDAMFRNKSNVEIVRKNVLEKNCSLLPFVYKIKTKTSPTASIYKIIFK